MFHGTRVKAIHRSADPLSLAHWTSVQWTSTLRQVTLSQLCTRSFEGCGARSILMRSSEIQSSGEKTAALPSEPTLETMTLYYEYYE